VVKFYFSRPVKTSHFTETSLPGFRPPRRGADLPVLFEVSNKVRAKRYKYLPTRYGWGSAVCHRASVPSCQEWPLGGFGGVVFAKLSKLLNQEYALSAPCLRGSFGSPQGPSRSEELLRTGVIRHFHIFV